MATFTVTATIPYALRNEGCAVDEMEMRRKAAEYIEVLEAENGELGRLLDEALAILNGFPEHAELARVIRVMLHPDIARPKP